MPRNRGARRSTCVQTAQLEYMKRFGMAEMFSYILIGGSWHSPVAAHRQNTGFCSASPVTGARIQQGSECLAEFAFRNAFRHQLQKCLAPVRQHCYAMHLEGDWRTCAFGCSAVGGRSTCVQTVRLEHMKRFDMVEMFSWLLIAETSIRQVCRSSAKHGGFAQQARHAAAPLREQLP